MKKKQLLLFLILFGWAAGLKAQITFTAVLDTNRILIGEQTTLTLTASGLNNPKDVLWPAWPDSIKELEVLTVTGDTLQKKALYTINQRYLITCFDSGYVLIPPFTLLADSIRLETEPLILNVSTVELDPAKDYYDIKSPVNAPIDWWYWIKRFWLVAAIGSLVIALALWLWLRKRKQAKVAAQPVDLRTPAQRAKDELNALLAERLWQNDQVKAYYSRTTDITRTYLEETFGIAAMEMITDELLEGIRPKVSTAVYDLIKQALQTADLVKFAKVKPGPETHEALWRNCMDIITLTEPKVEPNDA